MLCLRKNKSASGIVCSWRYLHSVFTFVTVVLFCSLECANCANDAVVSRLKSGDKFTNPLGRGGCAGMNASCVRGLLNVCSVCVCRPGTETYRADLRRCVSTKEMESFTGCGYKGIQDVTTGFLNKYLPTLNFTKKLSKAIRANLGIFATVDKNKITCEILNSSSYLNSHGEWVEFSNIDKVLHISLQPGHANTDISRYLFLEWEGVEKAYFGHLIKLQISCRTTTDTESGCFAFKTQGRRNVDPLTTSTVVTATTSQSADKFSRVVSTKSPKAPLTTEKVGVDKNNTYSVSMPVIIGVSVGVGLVILIIIVLAVCFVRYRTRKKQEAKATVINAEPPKVHFTAQARFSLIQEAAPTNPDDEDYTSLKENRESYDPYCSLRKDDVDLNVIETILKDAVSMESMGASSEPRYSCRLTEDDAIVIETKPISPRRPQYHVLEGPDDVIEPDYEEVDTSDDEYATTSSRLLTDTKPPLPEREYHELERPSDLIQSEC